MTKTELAMCENETEMVEIQIDAELYEKLQEILPTLGMTVEVLIQRFFGWCVNPETKEDAMAWLLKYKEEMA